VTDLQKSIYDAGMVFGGVKATITGTLTTFQGALALKVPESGQVFLLVAEEEARKALATWEGLVTMKGELKSGDNGPDLLKVASFKSPK